MKFRTMNESDYKNIISLWRITEGVSLRDADSEEGINKYLQRNPGLSFVAECNGEIMGTIMAGHDGKRGYIQHLAVASLHRKKGIATELLELCQSALRAEGIMKYHIHVLCENESAKTFWKNRGWIKRNDIDVFSFVNGDNENV